MKGFLFSLLLATSVTALVPSSPSTRSVRSTGLPKMSVFDDYVGGQGGFGAYNFDPLGFAEKSPELVPWYREAEIKHGRICMLAVVGFITAEYVRLPGDIFQGMSVVEAHNAMVASGSMQQLLLWIGVFETIIGIPSILALQEGEREPGDFQFGLAFAPKDPEKFKLKQLAELKNGRLAMLGFSGMVTQSVLSGHGFPYVF